MFLTFSWRKSIYTLPFLAGIILLLFSCQKDVNFETAPGPAPDPVPGPQYDLSSKISSTVSGFVTDENNAPVKDAVVQFGTYSTSSDKYGYFEAKDVQVTKNAAFVTVSKAGYFKGVKTYIAQAGKTAFFRIKLIPKTIAGTVNASAGGSVVLTNGLSVSLPSTAVVNAATNVPYTGVVNVAAYWIDPTSTELNKIMPGDLRGLNSNGEIKLLTTYGMMAVELTGSGGELLQIAPGKKATLNFPIPSSLSSAAPSTIPLWYFDETKGLWKQEGSATKAGNNYTGDVSHFSFWNCDTPVPTVQFNCTVIDAANRPVPNAEVWIYYNNGQFTGCMGITDFSGYASGSIPANSQLIVKIIDNTCPTQIMATQSITTTNADVSLGNISIGTNNIATITGSLTNCNGQAVTNGYIMMNRGGGYTRYNANSSGIFTFSTLLCGNNNVNIIGGDIASGQEGLTNTFVLTSGNNNVGNIIACGTTNQEYVNYTIDGTAISIIPGIPSWSTTVLHTADVLYPNSIYIEANSSNTLWFRFNDQNISAGSNQDLYHFWDGGIGMPQMPTIPIQVHITEYGNIGQFISGNFSGTIYDFNPPNNPHAITCNFRVRRQF